MEGHSSRLPGKEAGAQGRLIVAHPWLAFLNAKGEFLTEDGRMIVSDALGDIEHIWTTLMALNK